MKTLTEHNADYFDELEPTTPTPAGVLCPQCNTEMNIATISALNDIPEEIAAGNIEIIPVLEAGQLVLCPNCDYVGFKM